MSGANEGISRRGWLVGAAALLWLGCREQLADDPITTPTPRALDSYAAGPQHFADLGSEGCVFELPPGGNSLAAACARALPGEITAESLSMSLFGQPTPPDAATGLPKVGAAVRADFEAGRTMVVKGWVLAPSEAQLLALAFLQGCRAKPPDPIFKNPGSTPPSAAPSG
jgi:hypothetical protein